MLNRHDLIMREGKEDREEANKTIKPKNEASKREVTIGVSIEDNNSNMKQREKDRNTKQKMDQFKDMLDIEIEEI